MPVKEGDTIKVEYTGTFEDGTVFDSSEKHGQPLEFQAGAGQVVKGFDSAIMGMEVEEEKEITLQPTEAYGDVNPELVREEPKDKFPKDQELKEGMMLLIQLPNGMRAPLTVKKVEEDKVTVDLNHPLAGKVLKFKIKIVGITPAADAAPKAEEKPAAEDKPAEK